VRRFRFGAAIPVAAMTATIALGAMTGPVLANGIGDLYVAAAAGVDEVHVDTSKVVNTVVLTPAPTDLAFTPDGLKLYSADGGRFVTRIDIETISVETRIAVPGTVSALAHGRGDLLAIAYAERKTVGILDPADDSLTETAALPGAVDLLAANRHEGLIVAAEHGATWLAIIDPATRTVRKTTLAAEIVAIAIDPAGEFAYAATMGTNLVVRIKLSDASIVWQAALGGAPVAITASPDSAFVSVGPNILEAADGEATAWAKAAGEVGSLAASDDGGAIYATEGDAIQAFDATGKLARTISLPADAAPTALAPVPRASSIAGGGSGAIGGAGASGGPDVAGAIGAGASAKPHAPSTDTLPEELARVAGLPWIPGAVLSGLVLLAFGMAFGRWYVRRSTD
jgi:DNA-binding beta-propeller fold protein YncE